MNVTGAKVRAAKAFLGKHAKARARDISPRKFAAAAQEQSASFADTLRLITYYYSSGDEREELRHNQLNQQATQ